MHWGRCFPAKLLGEFQNHTLLEPGMKHRLGLINLRPKNKGLEVRSALRELTETGVACGCEPHTNSELIAS